MKSDSQKLGRVFDLHWIDPALHTTNEPVQQVADYERSRRFPHCGAAIAWARRQIYHGKVFGEHVEMHTIFRDEFNGEVREHLDTVTDITLLGFRPWEHRRGTLSGTPGMTLGRPERKHKVKQ